MNSDDRSQALSGEATELGNHSLPKEAAHFDHQSHYLYQRVVDLIRKQIIDDTLNTGDRLPSLRSMSVQMQVSVPTVRQAYLELERQGFIQAKAKSGYFVQMPARRPIVGKGRSQRRQPCKVQCRLLLDKVYDAVHQPGVVPLGIAIPCMAQPATKTLHRTMKRVMTRTQEQILSYAPTVGEPSLRSQIAFRYQQQFEQVNADQVLITNGAQEATAIALQCCAKPGDVIAVESPSYHGHMEIIESLGMLVLEIETDPVSGISISSLEQALGRHDIKACLFSSAMNNPLGSLTRDDDRAALVRLLEAHQVPLIEDDVYGELIYSGRRPPLARRYATSDWVMTCSSFAKTLAPGYRIGWLLAGRYHERACQIKRALSCSSGLLQQLTLSEFLASGEYDRHLKRLLPVLKNNAQRMRAAIEDHFPHSTRVSQPQGGSVLWLELERHFDSRRFFDDALEQGISLMPGAIFAAADRFNNYLRLSYGHPWSDAMEQAIERLGKLAHVAQEQHTS